MPSIARSGWKWTALATLWALLLIYCAHQRSSLLPFLDYEASTSTSVLDPGSSPSPFLPSTTATPSFASPSPPASLPRGTPRELLTATSQRVNSLYATYSTWRLSQNASSGGSGVTQELPTPSPRAYVDMASTHSLRHYFGTRFPLLPASMWYYSGDDLDAPLPPPAEDGEQQQRKEKAADDTDNKVAERYADEFGRGYIAPRFYPSLESVVQQTGLKLGKGTTDLDLKAFIAGSNFEPLVAVLFDGVVSRTGSVLTDSTFVPSYPDQHVYRGIKLDIVDALINDKSFKCPYYTLSSNYSAIVDELLVVTHEHIDMFWHRIISEYYRVLPVLRFLLANPRIYLHVAISSKENRKTVDMFKMLGIAKERLVSDKVKAKIIYLTQAVDRDEVPGTPNALMIREQLHNVLRIPHDQRSSVLCSNGMSTKTKETTEPQGAYVVNVLIIVRGDDVRGRMIVNQKEMEQGLLNLSSEYESKGQPVRINISRHTADLSMNETFALFAKADIVIGPHGAGFANLYATRSCAHVVELVQARHLNVLTSGRLGLAFHGVLANQTQDGLDPVRKSPRSFNFLADVALIVGIVHSAIQQSDIPKR